MASLVVGLPMLLAAEPAAAAGAAGLAGAAGVAVGSAATSLGVAAAFWALLGAMPIEDTAARMTMLGIAAALIAAWWAASKLPPGLATWLCRSRPVASAKASPSHGTASERRLAVPPGLDGEQVLAAARGRFMGLQAAWDAGDVAALQKLTTPDMLDELMLVLTARDAGGSRTDVISLHAELLALEELGPDYLASVEFSGLIRESDEQGEQPFRELWMLAATKDGSPSWRLARQQALF